MATPTDSAWLAATVRSLAGDVRRLVAEGPANGDAAAVTDRLQQLRDQVQHLPPSSLHRWIDNLEREVASIALPESASSWS